MANYVPDDVGTAYAAGVVFNFAINPQDAILFNMSFPCWPDETELTIERGALKIQFIEDTHFLGTVESLRPFDEETPGDTAIITIEDIHKCVLGTIEVNSVPSPTVPGNTFPSGVYDVTVRSSGYQTTEKVLVLNSIEWCLYEKSKIFVASKCNQNCLEDDFTKELMQLHIMYTAIKIDFSLEMYEEAEEKIELLLRLCSSTSCGCQ